jgi:hypothetical protein
LDINPDCSATLVLGRLLTEDECGSDKLHPWVANAAACSATG